MPSSFATRLLHWYARNARRLPWRDHPSPYAIWVSEMMLQQTRVETVIPYFERWMERFPTVDALAHAPLEEVLIAWEGLGYYRRAHNMHRAARMMVAEHTSQVPANLLALRSLPGIGSYSAAAIASIAFGLDEPALDGNVRRVLARVFNLLRPTGSPEGEQTLRELAALHLPTGRAGDYNQALMDLGASLCTPRSPACQSCPVEDLCQARALGVQEERPLARPRRPIPHHTVTAAVIRQDGSVLIARRPAGGLLGGLWEFPGGKLLPGEDLPTCLQREIYEELGVKIEVAQLLGVYHHAYTHFRITLHAFHCQLLDGAPRPIEASELCWAPLADLEHFPMGKIDRQIAAELKAQDIPEE